MGFREKRLDTIYDEYLNGNLNQEQLDAVLDGWSRDELPFCAAFIYKSSSAKFARHPGTYDARILGFEVEQDGPLFVEQTD